MPHAYLIMAHEISNSFRTLLKLIDDERNDIFIHIDAKTDFNFRKDLIDIVSKSKIYFTSNRIDVKWAHISQVEAEYLLYELAHQTQKYAYYHFLSGSDLPIKSQHYIHDFFVRNLGKEFIGYGDEVYGDRVKYIHLFASKFRSKNPLIIMLRKSFILIQKYIGFSKLKHQKWEIKKGTNWSSITDDFVAYMLQNQQLILNLMKDSRSPDEFYRQTLAFNSRFRDRLYSLDDEFKGCMRLIDWERGKPYNWQEEDLDQIISSDKLFARKFLDKNENLIASVEQNIAKGL